MLDQLSPYIVTVFFLPTVSSEDYRTHPYYLISDQFNKAFMWNARSIGFEFNNLLQNYKH